MSKTVLALGVAVIAMATYANSLANGFVWDDPIILSRQLPVFQSLTQVLFPPRNIPQFASDYYRPLVIGSYLVDLFAGGGAAWPFHLTVVLAHALTSLAVLALGDQLLRRVRGLARERALLAAGLGAAVFAVHPVHSEAVAWVAGRADVFAALFGVVAVYAHLRSSAQPSFALVTGAALLLALFAKEVAISVVLLLVVADWLVPAPGLPARLEATPRALRRRGAAASTAASSTLLLRYGPAALALALYGMLRWSAVVGGVATTEGQARGSLPARFIAAVALYAGKLVVPVSLNAYISDLPEGAGALAAGLVVMLAYGGALALALRRRQTVAAFLLLWPLVTLAPSLTILFKIPGVPAAERYLYLPSVGFCLLLGWGGALALGARHALVRATTAIGLGLLLLAFAGQAVVRNRAWASDRALWSDTAMKSGATGMPLRSLGTALFRDGDLDGAQRAYEQALERHNDDNGRATIYLNLGTIALTRGETERAEAFYRQATELQPTPDGIYNLGVISLRRAQEASGDAALRRAQASAALEQLLRAESGSPHDPEIQVAIGQALDLLDRPTEAAARYRRALALGLSGPSAERIRQLVAAY